jgi:hypothetical protein
MMFRRGYVKFKGGHNVWASIVGVLPAMTQSEDTWRIVGMLPALTLGKDAWSIEGVLLAITPL